MNSLGLVDSVADSQWRVWLIQSNCLLMPRKVLFCLHVIISGKFWLVVCNFVCYFHIRCCLRIHCWSNGTPTSVSIPHFESDYLVLHRPESSLWLDAHVWSVHHIRHLIWYKWFVILVWFVQAWVPISQLTGKNVYEKGIQAQAQYIQTCVTKIMRVSLSILTRFVRETVYDWMLTTK